MLAVDSSTWIAYFGGAAGADVETLDRALREHQVVLPAPVLTELLSDPKIDPEVAQSLRDLPLLEPTEGFWERAGALRAGVLRRKRKARLADALIAQLCLDHEVRLLTRDGDFRAFDEVAETELLA
jgi:predicted nucleic acid-binding protein